MNTLMNVLQQGNLEQKKSKQRRILQCAREISPGGGVSGVAFNLEREFYKLGVDCDRFTIQNIGLQSTTVRKKSKIWNKLYLLRDVILYSILGTLKLKRKSHETGTTVICHSDALYGDIYIMHGLHKALIANSDSKVRMLLRNPLHLFLLVREELRYGLHVHKAIVAFSKIEKQQILKYYKSVPREDIHIIPNGVDLNRFRVIPEMRRQIRESLGISEKSFVLIFVGHEFERKGLRHVLDALQNLKGDGHDVHLIVAGRDTLENLRSHVNGIQDVVHHVGNRSDIESYYSASDAFVLPTSFDSWALVGLEAMACSLPILMTKVGGIPEYLSNGYNGFFIERDGTDIAKKTKELLSNQSLRSHMGINAHKTAKNYGWESIARKYLQLVNDLEEKGPQYV